MSGIIETDIVSKDRLTGAKVYSGEHTGAYKTIAASQSNSVLGSVGAAGDYLARVVVVVATAATAQVQLKDGSGTAFTIFPNSPGGGIGTYTIPIGIRSRAGAWQITTGAGVSVVAVGNFT